MNAHFLFYAKIGIGTNCNLITNYDSIKGYSSSLHKFFIRVPFCYTHFGNTFISESNFYFKSNPYFLFRQSEFELHSYFRKWETREQIKSFYMIYNVSQFGFYAYPYASYRANIQLLFVYDMLVEVNRANEYYPLLRVWETLDLKGKFEFACKINRHINPYFHREVLSAYTDSSERAEEDIDFSDHFNNFLPFSDYITNENLVAALLEQLEAKRQLYNLIPEAHTCV